MQKPMHKPTHRATQEGNAGSPSVHPWLGRLSLLALSVYAGCCLLWWSNPWWWPEWDSALYILTARSMAAGEG